MPKPDLTKKVTFNLPVADIDFLEQVAAASATTKTAILRRCIRLETLFAQAEAENAAVILERPDGTRKEIVRL